MAHIVGTTHKTFMFIPLRAEPVGQVLGRGTQKVSNCLSCKYKDPQLEIGRFSDLALVVVPWCFWVLAHVWAVAELLFLFIFERETKREFCRRGSIWCLRGFMEWVCAVFIIGGFMAVVRFLHVFGLVASGILVPDLSGMKPVLLHWNSSLNHWTIRESLGIEVKSPTLEPDLLDSDPGSVPN